jgi:hypothetical protein
MLDWRPLRSFDEGQPPTPQSSSTSRQRQIVSREVLITQRQINCSSIIFDNYAVGLPVA